jgi:hypothetical protein
MPAQKKKLPEKFTYNGVVFKRAFLSVPSPSYIESARKIHRKDGYYTKLKKIPGRKPVLYVSETKRPKRKSAKPKSRRPVKSVPIVHDKTLVYDEKYSHGFSYGYPPTVLVDGLRYKQSVSYRRKDLAIDNAKRKRAEGIYAVVVSVKYKDSPVSKWYVYNKKSDGLIKHESKIASEMKELQDNVNVLERRIKEHYQWKGNAELREVKGVYKKRMEYLKSAFDPKNPNKPIKESNVKDEIYKVKKR